jgi:hypothetical protein
MIPKRDKEKLRAQFLERSVPPKRRAMVEKAFAATCSPRAAIKAHCFVCAGMEIEEAKNCQVVTCVLYEFNGYRTAVAKQQGDEDGSDSQEA